MNKKLISVAVFCLAFFLFFTCCLQLVMSAGPSMEPTIPPGTLLLCWKYPAQIRTGDVVLIRKDGQLLLKRVCAVAGDPAVAPLLSPGKEPVSPPEQSLIQKMHWDADGQWTQYDYWEAGSDVPEGYVFVTGDNLADSYDSRDPAFGLVAVSDIAGIAIGY